jgi:hypothetical protein
MPPVPGSKPAAVHIVFKEVPPLARRLGSEFPPDSCSERQAVDSTIVGLWPSSLARIEHLRQVFRVSKRADVFRHIVQPAVIANPVAATGVRRLCVDWRGSPPRFHVGLPYTRQG